MPTELMWDGKYKDGKKVSPLRISLPFQDVETVNESAQERQKMLDLFSSGRPSDWRNRLIWGDKRYVLPSLLDEFAGKIDLIYIDPPFDTGADFSFTTRIPDSDTSFTKEPSIIEQKAYRDTWGRGLDSYLQWFYETVVILYELLADTGSIYVHLDWHVGHYAKAVLDEVFGTDSFQNEIVWKRTSAHSSAQRYGPVHDVLLFYAKSESAVWNGPRADYEEAYLDKYYRFDDGDGRLYWRADLCAAGVRKGKSGMPWRGVDPGKKGMHWKFGIDTLDELDAQGRIYWPKSGTMPQYKRYREELKGKAVSDIWDDIDRINPVGSERTGYPTQKPLALLERVISASTNEDDLILDCFGGSGTTAVAAEKFKRRWITCDLGRFAVHTTRKRLLDIPGVKPFVVQNLGKYERQLWQADEFGLQAALRVAAYTTFLLDLYHARPLAGRAWLHGVKGNRVVHVGSIDSPVTLADVRSIIIEWQRNVGKSEVRTTGIDVLGWDFAFELNEVARQQALDAGVDLKFYTIPREVLEKKAVEQGDIQFFELAALFVNIQVAGRTLTVELTNFVPPLDYVPQEVRAKIIAWESWIDYWSVDFEFMGDTFHNEWQSYRTKANKAIATKTTNTYDGPGTYCVNVKVIDILGNDTTRTLHVEVA